MSVSLREAVNGRFLIGAAVKSTQIADPALGSFIAHQFDTITAENDFKPARVQPRAGEFDFSVVDQFVDFAQANRLQLVGHTLLWHNQTPAFLFADDTGKPLPRDTGLQNLQHHIHSVAGHVRGRVLGWDVVNEAIDDSAPYLRDTVALRSIGDDYLEHAFRFAHEADPNAQLYYNDYSIESDSKLPKTLRLLKELKSAGAPIHGVGIQGHWTVSDTGVPERLDRAIRAFSQLGLKVMITELDIDVLPRNVKDRDAKSDPYVNGLPDAIAQAQADLYAAIFAVVLKHPGVVERVTFWCLHDGVSWLDNWPIRGRTNHPLLWDRNLSPKPAFDAVLHALRS